MVVLRLRLEDGHVDVEQRTAELRSPLAHQQSQRQAAAREQVPDGQGVGPVSEQEAVQQEIVGCVREINERGAAP